MSKTSGHLMLFLFLAITQSLFAQSIFGKWKTIDDSSGKAKSILNIYQKGEKVYANVVNILEEGKQDATCVECKGRLKDQPIMGMQIINGLVQKDLNEYSGGTILDPENGQHYRCRIWLEEDNPNRLKVRGYLAIFYRTQTWIRITD